MGLEPTDVLFIAIVIWLPSKSSTAVEADAGAVFPFALFVASDVLKGVPIDPKPTVKSRALTAPASRGLSPALYVLLDRDALSSHRPICMGLAMVPCRSDRHRRRPGRPGCGGCARRRRSSVQLFEARPFLGGRATSYETGSETIDNCQHILLRCCVNLLDFYRRLGVAGDIAFLSRILSSSSPAAARSVLRAGMLPAPAHFTGSLSAAEVPEPRRKDGRRARPSAPSGARTLARAIWTASPCSNGWRKAPAAARHRAVLAAGAGQRDQRRAGPHGRRARLSGVPPRLPGARGIPTKWACPRCRSAHLYRREAWAEDRQRRDAAARARRTDRDRERRGSFGILAGGEATARRLLRLRAAVRARPRRARICRST